MAILISAPQDLHNIRNNLSGSYELINDIDMASWGNFTPIGNSSNRFTGSINGKGYKIKNLTINQSYTDIGLFGYAENATIQNLAVENANMTSNNFNYVGILIGHPMNCTTSNCYTTGQVSGQYGVGGLIGYGDVIINNCFSHGTVIGKGRVGGLIGNLGVNSSIDNSYSTGLVTVTPDPNLFNGGLVGSVVGTPSITNTYWDIETSGQTISAGGEGNTTSEMKTQSTYTDWDFTTTWGISGDYPYLLAFGSPVAPPKIETITVDSYVNVIVQSLDKQIKSTKQVESYSDAIHTTSERHTATLRSISTYLSQIDSNATQSHRSVRTGDRNVDSFILPIGSFINRESKTIKALIAHIKPLEANISVLYPLMDIPIYAYSEVIQNPSSVSEVTNMSDISYIQNPSGVEVI